MALLFAVRRSIKYQDWHQVMSSILSMIFHITRMHAMALCSFPIAIFSCNLLYVYMKYAQWNNLFSTMTIAHVTFFPATFQHPCLSRQMQLNVSSNIFSFLVHLKWNTNSIKTHQPLGMVIYEKYWWVTYFLLPPNVTFLHV